MPLGEIRKFQESTSVSAQYRKALKEWFKEVKTRMATRPFYISEYFAHSRHVHPVKNEIQDHRLEDTDMQKLSCNLSGKYDIMT